MVCEGFTEKIAFKTGMERDRVMDDDRGKVMKDGNHDTVNDSSFPVRKT